MLGQRRLVRHALSGWPVGRQGLDGVPQQGNLVLMEAALSIKPFMACDSGSSSSVMP
jgi:hypothetical protein